MSFNLYFAGWGSKYADAYLRSLKANRLLSQVNERRVIDWWAQDGVENKLFIDSGAFSVAHAGKVVDIDDYIDYINCHPNIPIFVELDVIPFPVLNSETARYCADESWKNYIYMKDRIFTDCKLLPLYHFGEPKDALLRILNTEVNGRKVGYIGIGGRHGVSTDEQCRYFDRVFATIQSSNNPKVKVHAFGITVPKILESFPFYSADSTTWVQVAINGSILCKDLSTIKVSNKSICDKDNIKSMPTAAIDALYSDVASKGYDLEKLCSDYNERLKYNIDVMREWANNYRYKGVKRFKSNTLF